MRKKKKFTWPGYLDWFSQPNHGGYTEAQCRTDWAAIQAGSAHCDELGVVQGVGGHKRWRVPIVQSSSASGSISDEEMEYSRGTKARKDMEYDDIHDVLAGQSILDIIKN